MQLPSYFDVVRRLLSTRRKKGRTPKTGDRLSEKGPHDDSKRALAATLAENGDLRARIDELQDLSAQIQLLQHDLEDANTTTKASAVAADAQRARLQRADAEGAQQRAKIANLERAADRDARERRDVLVLADARERAAAEAEARRTKTQEVEERDVVELVKGLNAHIEAAAAAMAGSRKPGVATMPPTGSAESVRRLERGGWVGEQLLAMLHERGRGRTDVVKAVLQVGMASFVRWVVMSWDLDACGETSVLEDIYAQVECRESTSVARRWKALTRSHMDRAVAPPSQPDRLYQTLFDFANDVLLVGGGGGATRPAGATERVLSEIVGLALDVRLAAGVSSMSREFVVYEAEMGSGFDAPDIEVASKGLILSDIEVAGFKCSLYDEAGALSIFVPVATVVGQLPAHALKTLDRRLITTPHCLTLFIRDSQRLFSPEACSPGVKFSVGLSRTDQIPPSLRCGARIPHDLTDFNVSSALEDAMNDLFLGVFALRRRYRLGWAGAEVLHFKLAENMGRQSDESVYNESSQHICHADELEAAILDNYGVKCGYDSTNMPLLAFRYLLRRFLYSICSEPTSTDLIVSLAYTAAAHHKLSPLPIGLGLRIGPGDPVMTVVDALTDSQICDAVLVLLSRIPSIAVIKSRIEAFRAAYGTTSSRVRVQDLGFSDVPEASWILLRWAVASFPMRIEEIRAPVERVGSIDSRWRQFRLVYPSPQAEYTFAQAVRVAQAFSMNARRYPSVYGFHGSPVHNWHSILHHGLWSKHTANARKFGDGIYFSKTWSIAEEYAKTANRSSQWPNRAFDVDQCLALAEVVNDRPAFVYSFSTHWRAERYPAKKPSPVAKNVFVVDQPDWIVCRFLMVKGGPVEGRTGRDVWAATESDAGVPRSLSFVVQDPQHVLTADGGAAVLIPEFD
ncbi:uncharacterized protein BXZ73DRAFT_99090 [Epithele typhae]|uniref:uncharacterized protein n=1 Tax=Epithele typhae TaxID=378194 RepID=UPI002007325A|nr:uncharacterized protein BXZ73DRAFT_99090 [Epithele typhae]KAH9940089.1 hypothetical protein BXZ73DRAFT_99090 [Epithele typhae]